MKEARTYRAGLKNKYIIVSFLLILHERSCVNFAVLF